MCRSRGERVTIDCHCALTCLCARAGHEESGFRSTALEATDRLKQTVMNEREEKLRLQDQVDALQVGSFHMLCTLFCFQIARLFAFRANKAFDVELFSNVLSVSVRPSSSSSSSPEVCKQAFFEVTPRHQNYVQIFTDGSKVDERGLLLKQCRLLPQIAPSRVD